MVRIGMAKRYIKRMLPKNPAYWEFWEKMLPKK
jgi:hypothetical protein